MPDFIVGREKRTFVKVRVGEGKIDFFSKTYGLVERREAQS